MNLVQKKKEANESATGICSCNELIVKQIESSGQNTGSANARLTVQAGCSLCVPVHLCALARLAPEEAQMCFTAPS